MIAPGDPTKEEARRSRLMIGTGFAGFCVVCPLLYLVGGVPLLDAILLGVLLVLMPAFAVAQAAMLHRLPFDRLAAYWSSIVTLWVIGATSWLVGTRSGGPEAIGLVPLPLPALLAWTLGLAVAGLAVMLVFRLLGRRLVVRETRMLARLLPRTRTERRVFVLLSGAAGLGEEVAYRGYVIPMLAVATGVPAAVVLSSLVFGLLHAYQGRIGMVRTALMGFVLAGGYLASGSLLPVVLAHTVIDLVGGLAIAEWLVGDRPAPGRAAEKPRPEPRDSKSLAETTDADDE